MRENKDFFQGEVNDLKLRFCPCLLWETSKLLPGLKCLLEFDRPMVFCMKKVGKSFLLFWRMRRSLLLLGMA